VWADTATNTQAAQSPARWLQLNKHPAYVKVFRFASVYKTTMRVFILFYLILNGLILHGQTYSKVVTDSEIIEFINKDIKRDSVKVIKPIKQKISILRRDDFYYKDSADFKKKNDKNHNFIFRYHKLNRNRIITENIDTLFSREDIDFFYTQFKGQRKRKYWKRPFENSVFIDEPELDSNNNAKQVVYYYSVPIFSKNKKRAIIEKYFFCGIVCGGGGLYIYEKKENDEWLLLKIINRWAN